MEENKKHKIRTFDLIMAFIVTTLGALFFLCITRSLAGESILNPWFSAMMCAVAFLTFLSVFAVTVAKKKMIIPIVIIAFLPSVIFMPVIIHMVVVVLAILVALKGMWIMRETLFNGLKINMGTIVKSGIAYLTFSLILVISSQYYFFIKDNAELAFDASKNVELSNMVVDYILQKSGVEAVSINTMSVDDFLNFMIENMSEEVAQGPRVKDEDREMLVRLAGSTGIEIETLQVDAQETTLNAMRENISEIVGREINGSEMVSDVMGEIISAQIESVVNENVFLKEYKSEIFAVVFFIIIFSLAAIIRFITVLTTRFIFMLFREFKIVKVIKTQRDAEVIVL
ncbi:MAG: hypothetical protein ACKUBY_00650 [Candidatus Moraniibacteriota bacterium]|jgi:hypothetical protein